MAASIQPKSGPRTRRAVHQEKTERQVATAHKQAKALELRLSGKTFDEIRKEVGYRDKSGALKAVQAAIRAITREPAEELVELELARIDRMLLGLWPEAITGNVHAVDRVIKLMERRSRYTGLDKPIQFDVHAMARELAVALELDENEAAELLTDAERMMLDQRKAAIADGLD